MSEKNHRLRCRWWRDNLGGLPFVFVSFLLFSSIGFFYIFLLFNNPNVNNNDINYRRCQEDDEGSWAIGVFYGDSPFALKSIEEMNVWVNKSAAWPVANPILTCASMFDSGFPSNFVADPFLYDQGGVLYMFFVTKSPINMQGDIGVAKSLDNGATWEQLGIALDEDWHLSFPFVFDFNGQKYMLPTGWEKGDLRLYRAVEFPLRWELEKVILKRSLIDAFIIKYEEKYWLFGSYHSRITSRTNGELEIWFSSTPLGPWSPHKKNPKIPPNGGKPFLHEGNLYRLGQDDDGVRAFKIKALTPYNYEEFEVDLGIKKPKKGINAWNGARSNHLDILRLNSGKWMAVSDGDRTASGDVSSRRLFGCFLIVAAGLLVSITGLLLGLVKFIIPLRWCSNSININKRSDAFVVWERSSFLSSKLRHFCSRLIRSSSFLRCKINPTTYTGKFVITVLLIISIALICVGIGYIYGGNGAQMPYPVNGHYSQFTLLAMTYDARLWNLKMYVKHYSRCASVREIVVVWNKGKPPNPNDFDSAVPVRIRVEKRNSLNNRFNIDPSIKTKAVLELDDDIMMKCDDIERGFKIWRENPGRLVGFYPRLVNGPPPLEYRPEKHARKFNGYNMILTGAAFMDGGVAFERYWGKEAAAGRKAVDEWFNCEDVLMNFLYSNNTPFGNAVEYVKPAWAIDTSKFSGVAISGNTQAHYRVRSKCLEKFTGIYGGLSDSKMVEFKRRKDGWDQ